MRWGPKSYSRARWLRFMAYYSRIYTVPGIRASPDSPAALNGIGGDQCPTYPNSPHTMINGGDSTDLPSPNHSSCESKPTTEEFLLRTARSTELTEALSGDFLAESAFRCDKNGQRETRIQLLLQFPHVLRLRSNGWTAGVAMDSAMETGPALSHRTVSR